MDSKSLRWLVYTVMVGMLPILSRGFAWMVTRAGTVEPVAASDFVALGLVLHISIINEMEHSPIKPSLRTAQHGFAVALISIYSVLYAIVLVGDSIVDKQALIRCSFALAWFSLLLCGSVYIYLERVERKE